MIQNTSFQKAVSSDAKPVLKLYHAVSGTPYCTWDEYYPGMEEIENDIRCGSLYLLKKDDSIVGAISIVPENELDSLPFWEMAEDAREIARVAVAPEFQGHALSELLVSKAEDVLRSQRCSAIHLLVAVNNIPARRTYEKCAFNILGECEMYGHTFYACEKIL